MVDEIFDRTYQSGRTDLNSGLDRGVARIGRNLTAWLSALYRIQWSAPWKPSRRVRFN